MAVYVDGDSCDGTDRGDDGAMMMIVMMVVTRVVRFYDWRYKQGDV